MQSNLNKGTSIQARFARHLVKLTVWLGLGLIPALTFAAYEYPTKPIRIIVPFAAGGPADILGRLVGNGLAERLKGTVLVVNQPGNGGNIGTDAVAKAPADGYTLLLGYVGPLAINPYLFKQLPFDPVADFSPIGLLATTPLVLVVHPSVPVNSVAELIAYGKSSKASLAYGSGGVGSANHLAGEIFKTTTGLDLLHVPYKGIAPATTDLLGGQTAMMFNGLSLSLPYIKSGKLRALAVTTKTRDKSLPDVPSLQEVGVVNYDVSAWFALLAPVGTPPAVLKRLEKATAEAMASAPIGERLATLGLSPQTMNGADFSRFMNDEMQSWEKAVRASGAAAN
ncbi:hypothetical protein PT7_2225 [Pusillimonas sp. T7-7]|uniref:Bug family tripartite tricarboxylate transporter substrate binding protein n=1 Tax=Pusillimonas sp. (strain T7-7) TaxID=1007105 RepID=UPI0002085433|nr:tripartite tricarboxylate transporter substrate binding protein [Pusillimonas sp. T7-7]AEC20765.1 hypothetical protein PT7_2225 [Pusillimonas sp. T7-7]